MDRGLHLVVQARPGVCASYPVSVRHPVPSRYLASARQLPSEASSPIPRCHTATSFASIGLDLRLAKCLNIRYIWLTFKNTRRARHTQIAALDCQGGAAVAYWSLALPCQLMSMAFGRQDNMAINLIILIVALIFLTLGAEALVRGASSLARHLGLTPLVIGLTVVAFGTSAPEMVVSVGGSLRGHGDIAVGNVVGSNIFNIGIILAISAIVAPIKINLGVLKLDAPLVIGASLLAALLIGSASISRRAGIFLLCLLGAYMVFSLYLARKQASEVTNQEFEKGVPGPSRSLKVDLFFILAGLGFLVLGSNLLVDSTMYIARALGVSEAVIGLTIVAAATSMPELATSLVAALRGQSDIAVGNVLGSNLFNILGILGLAASVRPLYAPGIGQMELWVMVAFSVALLPLLWTGRQLQRWEGVLLLSGYVFYVWKLWPS